MAFPVVKVNSATGSNTAASGAGPSTALFGTAAATAASTTVTLSVDAPDLSGVATDGSAAIWVGSSSGRQWSKITAVDNGAKTVTVSDAFANTESGKNWGIGGKRATLDGSLRVGLDMRAGWTIDQQTDDTLTANFVIRPNSVTQTPSYFTCTSGTRSTLTTSSSTVGCIDVGLAQNLQISNLVIKCTHVTPAVDGVGPVTGGEANYVTITNCVIDGWRRGLLGQDTGANWRLQGLIVERTEIKNCTANAIYLQIPASGAQFINCYIHNNNTAGTDAEACKFSQSVTCTNCIFDSNAKHQVAAALANNVGVSFLNCVFSNATSSGSGLTVGSSNDGSLCLKNCIFYGNAAYGVAGNVPNTFINLTNAYGGNGTAARENISAGTGDVTLSGNPFVSATDFGLNSTAGAGAACKGVATAHLGSANAAGDIGAIASGGGAAAGGGGPLIGTGRLVRS